MQEWKTGLATQPLLLHCFCTLLQSHIEEMRKPSAQYFLMFDLCDFNASVA